ncbi:MAG: hypothetical protein ACR2MT_15245 [Aurantibacter sp.]
MIWGISLILLSIIAVPSLILSKKPNANELLAKVEPYQGWLGIVFCFWGIWGIVNAVLNLGWLNVSPVWWATFLGGNVVSALLGFMLGSGLINKLFLSNNETAQLKAEEFRRKIAPKQGMLGILGLIVGAWMIMASFLYTIA